MYACMRPRAFLFICYNKLIVVIMAGKLQLNLFSTCSHARTQSELRNPSRWTVSSGARRWVPCCVAHPVRNTQPATDETRTKDVRVRMCENGQTAWASKQFSLLTKRLALFGEIAKIFITICVRLAQCSQLNVVVCWRCTHFCHRQVASHSMFRVQRKRRTARMECTTQKYADCDRCLVLVLNRFRR